MCNGLTHVSSLVPLATTGWTGLTGSDAWRISHLTGWDDVRQCHHCALLYWASGDHVTVM